jgi:nucleoside-diphosphate-sugar epimerase
LCRYNSRGDRGALEWFAPAETEGIEIRFGDVRDPESAADALRGIEVAFHLAAQIAIPYSYLNPRDFFETNVIGTLNVAQSALSSGLERLVHVSTSEVYGEPERWPITEDHAPNPRSPYAASKAAADMLVRGHHAAFGLPVVLARPFNTYGPHQSPRAIVPTIMLQALAGGELRLGRLEPRRDLTFVSDTVAGLMALGAAPDADGQVVQLGSGADVSVAELVALVGELCGRELSVEHDPERVRPATSEVSRLVADHTRATELTGWAPVVPLREGLAQTLEWIGANQTRFRAREYAR